MSNIQLEKTKNIHNMPGGVGKKTRHINIYSLQRRSNILNNYSIINHLITLKNGITYAYICNMCMHNLLECCCFLSLNLN